MTRATILHIDDDTNDVLLFRHAWRKSSPGLEHLAVHDGDEAVAYLSGSDKFADRETHPLPQLVLLDLKMPKMNGFDVLEWMRSDAQLRRIPVVVLTSSSHESDIRRAYSLGANSYIVKPVSFDDLGEVALNICRYWFQLVKLPPL